MNNLAYIGPYESRIRMEAIARRQRLYRPIKLPAKPVEPVVEAEPGVILHPADWPLAPSSQALITMVCAKHGVTRDELMSGSRERHIVKCRQECCYEIRRRVKVAGRPISLPRIGRALGGLDHTTVLSSIRVHEKRLTEGDV